MWKPVVILVLCLCSFTYAVPLGLKKNMAIVQEEEEPMLMLATEEETSPEVMISRLNLPSNATSIRADITDGFSCDNKTYGYYADVENECQIFHVCLPVTYADGKENTFRWSFICPEETVFSQDSFTCMRPEDMSIDCEESFKYYELNRNFGVIESEDTQSSAEEEMDMEEMSRQPPSEGLMDDNRQPIVAAAPVRKQTVKVQNSNRRKTQTNRITVDSQRKKVQPIRKAPQPLAPATTAKPLEEDAPIVEQEAERTTVKYQRFTKRPSTPIKEQAKPEASKPEQQPFRQELFIQKRKRPQTFSATRLDAAVQTESESKPEASEKTDIVVQQQQQPEAISRDQAEAQASEIAEVSIKPQMEKIAELKPIESEKTAPIAIKEKEPVLEVDEPSDLKSEIAPLPEKTPSRVEVVEIPIQKLSDPVLSEVSSVLLPTPENLMPIEPMKAEDEKLISEEILAEETMQAELTKILEKLAQEESEKTVIENPAKPEKPMEAEKVLFEPALEPEMVIEVNEPEKLPEVVKTAELPSKPEIAAPEPAKVSETVMEPEVPAAIPEIKLETPMANPEMPSKAEVPASEMEMPSKVKAPELEMPTKIESPAAKPEPTEPEKPLRVEVPAIVSASAPMKPMEAEKPTAKPEVVPKVETSEMPLKTQAELSLVVEAPVPEPEMPLKVEAIAAESEQEKPMVAPQPTVDLDLTKIAEIPPVAVELVNKPAVSELPAQAEAELEKSSEVQSEEEAVNSAEQMEAQSQASGEKNTLPSAAETEDTQTMILDFISSLVNSENSNLEEQSGTQNEIQSESMPEPVVTGEKPSESEASPNFPMMQGTTDQMYQIPVQIIETPEQDPLMPVAAEPKLPLSVDDVVELVKESLDTPAEKENLVQQPLDDQPLSQSGSDEVKPIYHRYFEFNSNLLKSEALTASDEDEPTAVSVTNDASMVKEKVEKPADTMQVPSEPETPKASEQPSKPEPELASEPEPLVNALPVQSVSIPLSADTPAMSRSMSRFKMDPRKRRFLFRSDAS